LHATAECTPCKFFRSRRGCRLAEECKLCHYPHEEMSGSSVRRVVRRRAIEARLKAAAQDEPPGAGVSGCQNTSVHPTPQQLEEHHRWLASACLDSLCGAGLVAADCMRPAVRIDQGAVTAVGADAGADDQRESLGALLRRIPPPTAHVPATAASASSARLGAGIPARAGRMGPPRHPTTLQGAGPLPALPNFQASPRHTQAAPLPPPQGAEPPRLKAAGSPLQSLATQAVVAGLGAPNLSQVFVKFSF